MRDTIDMAREAGLLPILNEDAFQKWEWEKTKKVLNRFADLVRADEREKHKWDVHSCGPTCEKYACVAMREAVEAEREACAKLCEDAPEPDGRDLADRIREMRTT